MPVLPLSKKKMLVFKLVDLHFSRVWTAVPSASLGKGQGLMQLPSKFPNQPLQAAKAAQMLSWVTAELPLRAPSANR